MRAERAAAARPASAGNPLHGRVKAYGLHHLRSAVFSLGKLWRAPLASAMTLAVIGIALALPASLYTLLGNVRGLGQDWDVSSSRVSLYLQAQISEAQIESLIGRLRAQDSIAAVEHISPQQGLEEFRAGSGFGAALDALDSNPLPHVLRVLPAVAARDPARIGALAASLQRLEGVEEAQVDLQWVQRLHALLDLLDRAVSVLGGLLATAVLLVVGNTIRLDIENRREEIEVAKLIGATDAFIRRPFLYGGLWYGLIGGLLAWLLVALAVWLLSAPAGRLALVYGSDFRLAGMGPGAAGTVLAAAAGLGWLGSWLAVGRHLSRIEPS